jgi:uncharacterized coiled-coil DUF342 family protein
VVQKLKTLSEKITKAQRVGDMDQVVKHLSSKCKALNSKPSTTKNKIKQTITTKNSDHKNE